MGSTMCGRIVLSSLLVLVSVSAEGQALSTQQRDHLANSNPCLMVHWGPNTFTGREIGRGEWKEKEVYVENAAQPDQWARVAAESGFKMLVLVCRHHDGFCVWPTATTRFASRSDLVAETAAACNKHNIRFGVYLSPANLWEMGTDSFGKEGRYGNGSAPAPRRIKGDIYQVDDYNEVMLLQLAELLDFYGPVYEVFFDGFHPRGKANQTYQKNEWMRLIRKLQPQAAVFDDEVGDLVWEGTEHPSAVMHGGPIKVVLGQPRLKQRAIKVQHSGWFKSEGDLAADMTERLRAAFKSVYNEGGSLAVSVGPGRDGKISSEDVKALRSVSEF